MDFSYGFRLVLALLFAGALANRASAQVSVELTINNSNYIQYEAIYAKVTLRNFSAHPLPFGESKELSGNLKFEIEGPDEGFVRQTDAGLPPMLGTILVPGETKTMTFILSKYYFLQKKGRYKVKAYIEHPQLTSAYESNACFFSIIDGNTILERSVGIPDFIPTKESSGGKIKTRKYSIISFFDGRNKVYAVSVEDESMVYAVKRIGFDMGANLKPSCEIDSLSRINILLPVSPKVFAYYVYGIDGKLEKRDIYMKTNTTPTLVADKKDGAVMIVGGRVARKDLDYDEFKDLPFMAAADPKHPGEDEDEE